jgi:membrane protein YdbS with pleckstrin-like domain
MVVIIVIMKEVEKERDVYTQYAEEENFQVLEKLKPSVKGFLRKYVLCFSPIIAVSVYLLLFRKLLDTSVTTVKSSMSSTFSVISGIKEIVDAVLMIPISTLKFVGVNLADVPSTDSYLPVLGLLIFLLIVSWVLSSTEASGSIGLAILLTLLISAVNSDYTIPSILSNFNSYIMHGAVAATLLLLLRTEVYRRSITYTLRSTDLAISGGIWRKQEQSIPYDQIGRVVLEQSWIGRMLNYGTIIPVGVAEWGAEYYTRAVGVQSSGVAVGYARTLKEISRDPMKCLYGISNPKRVMERLQRMITVPYRAEIDQVEYLRRIAEQGLKRELGVKS